MYTSESYVKLFFFVKIALGVPFDKPIEKCLTNKVVPILGLNPTKSSNFSICYRSAKSRHAIIWAKLTRSGSLAQGSGYLHTVMVVYLKPLALN